MNTTFSHRVRVYWEDTDAGGVVYHAQYLAFLERARSEWLRAQDYGQEYLRRTHNIMFAVRSMQLDFCKPARLDDTLRVDVALTQCRPASLLIAQCIWRDGERLLDAQVKVVALRASTFRPCAIPDELRAQLESLQQAG